ncbi:MAG: hypothetical protein HY286_14720 [Planctomycetes bacterium]|nr:hypothetical protein [Planctomycetota bacterium]
MNYNLLLATGLLVLGFLMIAAEIFIPSLGALSALAVISMIGGVVFAFRESFDWGVFYLLSALFGGMGMALLAFKIFPKTPMGKRLIIGGPTFADDTAAVDTRSRDLLGKSGIAITYLRPAGIIEIEGRRIDCVADGELLESGTHVVVMRIDGNRVLVKKKP